MSEIVLVTKQANGGDGPVTNQGRAIVFATFEEACSTADTIAHYKGIPASQVSPIKLENTDWSGPTVPWEEVRFNQQRATKDLGEAHKIPLPGEAPALSVVQGGAPS